MSLLLLALAVIIGVFVLTVVFGAPYVPSHRSDLDEAFSKLRPLSSSDVVLDFGGGDGAVCLAVCNQGAKAINYEINPILVLVSKIRLRRFKDQYRSKLVNYLQAKIPSDVTVVYVFSESKHITGIYKKIQTEATRQQKSFDVISYGFEIPGVEYQERSTTHFLYRVEPLLS